MRYSKTERELIASVLEMLPGFSADDVSKEGMQRSLVGLCLDLVQSNAAIVGYTGEGFVVPPASVADEMYA